MTLSTRIVRNPFGMTATALASEWYGDGSEWERFKARRCVEHDRDVRLNVEHLPGAFLGSITGFREDSESGDRRGEWWTVIVHDGVDGDS